MVGSIDDAGYFYTDLFYQNLNNDSSLLTKDYSIYSQFENNLNVDLIPQYPLARLSLAKGEFSSYFNKYNDFKSITHLKKQTLVNFSNPIFAEEKHIDDMSYFLNRMKDEFNCIDDNYVLYGNQKGQYPVQTEVKGGFTKEDIKKVNSEGIAEFLINSHGQKDNIDICYYENNEEKRQSLMNSSNINSILSDNYYYLDAWTCNSGTDMKSNIVTSALNGKCMGYFGATHIISNNGVDCYASFDNLKYCNFYYFYYKYLKSINNGYPRSYAFFLAQNSYAKVLLETSKDGMNAANGFNLCNLLSYHNFGVLEPYEYNKTYIDKEDVSLANTTLQTLVKKYDYISLDGSLLSTFDVDIYDYYCVFNADGSCDASLVLKLSDSANVVIFIPPNDIIARHKVSDKLTRINQHFTKEDLSNETIVVGVSKNDDDRCFINIDPKNLNKWNNKPKSDYEATEVNENKENDCISLDDSLLNTLEVDLYDYYCNFNNDKSCDLTLVLKTNHNAEIGAFIPPGSVLYNTMITDKLSRVNIKLTKEDLSSEKIMVSVSINDDDRCFIDIDTKNLNKWNNKPKSDYEAIDVPENNVLDLGDSSTNGVEHDYKIGTDNLKSFEADLRDYYYKVLDNSDYEITISLKVPNGVTLCAFIPPEDVLKVEDNVKGGLIDFTFTLPKNYHSSNDLLLSVGFGDNDRYFVSINIPNIANWKQQ